MRRLWLRADGDATMGIGHVVRCVALAEAAHRQGLATTLVTSREGVGGHVGGRAGLDVLDATPTLDWVKSIGVDDVVVFDGYHLGDELDAVAADAPATVRIGLVDDFGSGEFPVDLAVCPNPPADPAYVVKPHGVVLSGPRFAPVRTRFREVRRSRIPGRECLLLSFGGADPSSLLERTAAILDGSRRFRRIRAVVGPTTPVGNSGSISLVRDPLDMAAVMDAADAAVVAAGSTVWEACTVGLPLAAVPIADNQAGIERVLREANAALVVAHGPDFESDLRNALVQLAHPMVQGELAAAAMELVDGQGADRVVSALLA